MIKKMFRTFHLLCLSLLLAVSAFAQCKDPLCPGLQNILDAALTDFRAYRANSAATSALSTEGAKVPCQMSTWANNVPMYICYAQIPYANAEIWYTMRSHPSEFFSQRGNSKLNRRLPIILSTRDSQIVRFRAPTDHTLAIVRSIYNSQNKPMEPERFICG